MHRKLVQSTNLASVGYEALTRTLEIEFQNGRVYQYQGVPKPVFDQLMAASSKGQFFNSFIKDKYSYVQV